MADDYEVVGLIVKKRDTSGEGCAAIIGAIIVLAILGSCIGECGKQSSAKPHASGGYGATQVQDAAWERPKDWYRNELDVLRKNIETLTGGGYAYNRKFADSARHNLNSLDRALACNNPLEAEKASVAAHEDYKKFRGSCQWQIGVRHPRFRHVVSATKPGTWAPEDGWEFVDPGMGLDVRQISKPVVCRKCRGSGSTTVSSLCLACGGRGNIPGGVQLSRRGRATTKSIRCPACGGRGKVSIPTACPECSGAGKIMQGGRGRR